MIKVDHSAPNHGDETIGLYSNLSMSLDKFFAVFLLLSGVVLLVAVYPLIMGLWPVMVIAWAHILLLGVCFRKAWRGNWARQVIHFGPETVTIEHSAARERWTVSWPNHWLRLRHEQAKSGDIRLYLEKSGETLEIGAFLPPNERQELLGLMRSRLVNRSAWAN